MTFLADIVADIRNIPEIAKSTTAFAASLATFETGLAVVAQTTHIVPALWLQPVAAVVALATGAAVILTDLASSGSILTKAIDVVEEVGKVATEVKSDLSGIVVAPTAAAVVPSPVSNAASNAVANAVTNAVQPVIQDISTVVTDVASSAAAKVVDQVITDFKK